MKKALIVVLMIFVLMEVAAIVWLLATMPADPPPPLHQEGHRWVP